MAVSASAPKTSQRLFDLVQHKLQNWREEHSRGLELRRDKLFVLLQEEEHRFKEEMETEAKNHKSNQLDEMRKRVAELKKEKEERDKEFVRQKLDQCFKNQCDEMRSLMSKKIAKENAKDWAGQIKLKQRLECEAQQEELFWAKLSMCDVEEKERRDEQERQRRRELQIERLQDNLQGMQVQRYKKMMARQHQALQRMEDLKQLEQLQLEAKANIEANGEEQLKDQQNIKVRKTKEEKQIYRDQLLRAIEIRDCYRNRRHNIEVEAEQILLKQEQEKLAQEVDTKEDKQRENMRAIQVYRDYTQKRDCLHNKVEDSLQRLQDQVIEEQYQKATAFRDWDKQQRRSLHQNVMEDRAKQVEYQQQQRQKEAQAKIQEAQCIERDVEAYKQEQDKLTLQKNVQVDAISRDLAAQTAYNARRKEIEKKEEEREYELSKLQDRLYNHQYKATLKFDKITNSNPSRECVKNLCLKQCFRPV